MSAILNDGYATLIGATSAPGGGGGGQPVPNPPTGVTPGQPGTFTPAGSDVPGNLVDLRALGALGQTAAWSNGDYVVTGDNNHAYWNGSIWQFGDAPAPAPRFPMDLTLVVDDAYPPADGVFLSLGADPAASTQFYLSSVEKDGTDHTDALDHRVAGESDVPLYALVVASGSGAAALFDPTPTPGAVYTFDPSEHRLHLHDGTVTWNSVAFIDGEDVTVTLSETALTLPPSPAPPPDDDNHCNGDTPPTGGPGSGLDHWQDHFADAHPEQDIEGLSRDELVDLHETLTATH